MSDINEDPDADVVVNPFNFNNKLDERKVRLSYF